jgi:hypothetical protein
MSDRDLVGYVVLPILWATLVCMTIVFFTR